MTTFIQQLINGLHVGSIYALVALGYTMVYGIVKLINFAHGDVMMVGAFVAYTAIVSLGLPVWLAVIIAVAFCTLFGIFIEKVAYKPLRNAPRISALITAIGVSFALQNLFRIIFGASAKTFPVRIGWPAIELGGIWITWITIITVVLAVILMLALEIFVKKTKPGKAMRAVSEDQGAAQLMGININNTISLTFAIGAALAAVGGILYSIAYPSITPLMGFAPGIKAFIAAVLGGIGIMPGAMLGGFLMGIIESFTKGYVSTLWSDAIVYGILIVVLVVKPTGILGKNVREKV